MEIKNIYKKVLQVYSKVKTVYKDAEISAGKSSYSVVTHDSVTRLLHDPIAEAGIVPVPNQKSCALSTFEKVSEYNGRETRSLVYRADIHAEIRFVNSDDPNDVIVSEAHAYAFDTSDKAVGKAYSMALKMIYLKVFMLESQDEEEARPTEPNASYKQKQSYEQPKTTSAMVHANVRSKTMAELGAYVIQFGKKMNGKRIIDFTAKEHESMIAWLEQNTKETGKGLYGPALDYYEHAKLYIAGGNEANEREPTI